MFQSYEVSIELCPMQEKHIQNFWQEYYYSLKTYLIAVV